MLGSVSSPVDVSFPFSVNSLEVAPQVGIVPVVRVYLTFERLSVASISLGDAVVLFVRVIEARPACSWIV